MTHEEKQTVEIARSRVHTILTHDQISDNATATLQKIYEELSKLVGKKVADCG